MAEDIPNPAQTTGATTEGESDGQTVSAGALPEQAPGPGANTSATGPASAATPAEPAKRPYPAPAEVPTQPAARGIRFDFNDGCRVAVPEGKEPWHIRLSDLDTGNILYETELKAGRVNSTKRYFVRFRVEISAAGKQLLAHDYAAKGREVLIRRIPAFGVQGRKMSVDAHAAA